MAFKIIVCAKQVPDTNVIKINPKTGTLIRDGVPSILNHDDNNALEEALNSTGSVTSWKRTAKVNSMIPRVKSGRIEKIKPARNNGQESVDPIFATGTIAERRFSGT